MSSSVNNLGIGVKFSNRLFMWIRNSNSLRNEICRTPTLTSVQDEYSPFCCLNDLPKNSVDYIRTLKTT